MGGYFKEKREIKRVKLPSDQKYWVDVLMDVRWGELKRYIKITPEGKADLSTSADKYLLAIIHEWNLDKEDGSIAPIDQETIDLLVDSDVTAIINAAGGTVETEDSKKNSSSES